jgi:hypothetical protein
LAIELYQDGGYHEFIYSEDGYNLKIKCGNFIMPVIQLPPYIEGNDDNNVTL